MNVNLATGSLTLNNLVAGSPGTSSPNVKQQEPGVPLPAAYVRLHALLTLDNIPSRFRYLSVRLNRAKI